MLKYFFNIANSFLRKGVEISYTRVNTYKTCPIKYKLVFEDGMRVQPNPSISLGQSMHRTLEDFHARKADGLDELMDSYNQSWVNEGFVSPQQAQEFYEKGNRMLAKYWEEHLNSRTEIMFVEKDFRIPLGRDFLRGIIDRIDRHPDGAYEVIDYKTHAEKWQQDRVDSDLQLSVYALACSRAFGFVPKLLSYYFLAHNCKISTTRSPEQLEETVKVLEDAAAKISRRQYTPNFAHCPKCDFKKSCSFRKRDLKNEAGEMTKR